MNTDIQTSSLTWYYEYRSIDLYIKKLHIFGSNKNEDIWEVRELYTGTIICSEIFLLINKILLLGTDLWLYMFKRNSKGQYYNLFEYFIKK